MASGLTRSCLTLPHRASCRPLPLPLWPLLVSTPARLACKNSTHCQRLQPTWEDLATELKGKVGVQPSDFSLPSER